MDETAARETFVLIAQSPSRTQLNPQFIQWPWSIVDISTSNNTHSINTANPLPLTFLRPLKIRRLQIPRHTRQADLHAVNLLGHFNLTSQPRGLREPEGEIQHVVFVVRGFGHGVVFIGVVDDDVAGGAGAGSSAGTLGGDVREVNGERILREGRGEREGGPSISRSSAWAMSIRLSPAATSKLCWAPSLSMKVTCNLGLVSDCVFCMEVEDSMGVLFAWFWGCDVTMRWYWCCAESSTRSWEGPLFLYCRSFRGWCVVCGASMEMSAQWSFAWGVI